MPKEEVSSVVENKTLEDCLDQKVRLDGRYLHEYREIFFRYPNQSFDGRCVVKIGGTSIIAKVTYDIVEPRSIRPSSGILLGIRSNDDEARRLSSILQAALRDSVDLDSFCIVAWESVFSIKIELKLLSYDGNVADCGALAAIAALCTFKRPGVYVNEKGKVVVDQEGKVRPKVKIQLRRMPILVSFGLTNNTDLILVDPNAKEESNLITARVLVGMTEFEELCCLHTSHLSTTITQQLLQNCVTIAAKHAKALVTMLRYVVSSLERRVTLEEAKLQGRQSEIAKAEQELLNCPLLLSSREFLLEPAHHEIGEFFHQSDDEDDDAMSISSGEVQDSSLKKLADTTTADPYGVIELSMNTQGGDKEDSKKRKSHSEVKRSKKRALLTLLDEEEEEHQESVLTLI